MDIKIPSNNPFPLWIYGPILGVAAFFVYEVGRMLFRIAFTYISSKKTIPEAQDCPFNCSVSKTMSAEVSRLRDTALDKYKHQEEHATEIKERKNELTEFFKEMNIWKDVITEKIHGLELSLAGAEVKKN